MEAVAQVRKAKGGFPVLRFADFVDGWKKFTLTDKCNRINVGFVGTCEPYYTTPEAGVLLIRTGNIKGDGIDLSDVKYVTDEFHVKNKKSQVFPGDLLVARHGSNGQAALVLEAIGEAHCLNIVIIRTGSELDSIFLQNQLNSEALQNQIRSLTAGSTQGVINTGALASLDVTAPTLPEQQKIAGFLSAVDARIQQLTRKKALLVQYKKGVMQQLFSQEIRFTRADGSAFPEWEEKPLGKAGQFIGGGTPSRGVPEYWQGSIPWLSSSDISEGSITGISKTRFITEDAIKDSATKVIPPNSVLIVARVGVGKVAVNDVAVCTSQDYLNLIPMGNSAPFLAYLIQSMTNRLLSLNQGTSIRGFVKGDLTDLIVGFPTLEEQQKIADFLGALDARVQAVGAQVEGAQRWKKGLLQQMFV